MSTFKPKGHEVLHVASMGKHFPIRAITTTVEEANAFMASHPDTSLIACWGELNVIADTYSGATYQARKS